MNNLQTSSKITLNSLVIEEMMITYKNRSTVSVIGENIYKNLLQHQSLQISIKFLQEQAHTQIWGVSIINNLNMKIGNYHHLFQIKRIMEVKG